MKLRKILMDIPILEISGSDELDIRGITHSSKAVRPGYLFAALKGEKRDGMDFAAEAESLGASAVLSEWPKPARTGIAWIRVADAREALALAAANFYSHPSLKLKIVGITGTKGKTTTTYLLEEIFRTAGFIPGVIGTVDYRGPGFKVQAGRTTPEAPELQKMLQEMVDEGVSHCLLEVSSHALEQKRVWGVSFDVVVFTNLSGEHLDYHGSMENYFEAKKKLFFLNHKRNASVVNIDDPWGQRLMTELPMKTITFGLDPKAVVRAERYEFHDDGMNFLMDYPGGRVAVSSALIGKHNLYNILAAASVALAMNIPLPAIVRGIGSLRGVPGRFETVKNSRGLQIIVDYAHTDNALQYLLETVQELKPRRVLLVFGAGGNRDKSKRERMGEVASRLADWSVLTSDNPRGEDPLAIIGDIEKGFHKRESANYEVVPDRKEAIRRALGMARKGDYVLVAGKGHEDYQIFKDRTVRFSDVEVIRSLLAETDAG